MPLIRSISGLRATLGDSLTPSIVADYTAAFSALQPQGPIVVGRDGRPSGTWIADVVLGTLRACGRAVRMLDLVPTPTVQLFTEHSDAAGGIAITASHNPAPWNGLKFIGADGVFLDAAQNEVLWHRVDNRLFVLSADQQNGDVVHVDNAIERHISTILGLSVVQRAPHANGKRVVVDAVNCSASFIVPQLLERFGYTVIPLHCDGSGIFPHVPEPTAENLTGLGEAVREHRADFGIAVDPDGDRLVLYDEHGEPIGEENTIALAASAVLAYGNAGPVVVNYSTTRVVDDVAAASKQTTYRAPVGEINVVRRMQNVGAVIGGEGSGGVIYPACHYGRDAMVGIGLVTALLRLKAITMSAAVAELPRYDMIKTKMTLDDRAAIGSLLDECRKAFADAIIHDDDGLHAAWTDRWVHVRASNTEPIMRIIAEAPSREEAQRLIARVTDLQERSA